MVSFKFSTGILAASMGGVAANLRASVPEHRALSGAAIAGYTTGSVVTDHNAIDLDQAAMEEQLALQTTESFQNARAIYEEGAFSKSVARLTLAAPGLTAAVADEATVTGRSDGDSEVIGRAYDEYTVGTTVIEVQYKTVDVQDSYVECQVGANPTPNLVGCFQNTGDVVIGGVSYSYTYDALADNVNKRTLQGFSTAAQGKMGGKGYVTFDKFYNYYGEYDYADKWVTAAFDSELTTFTNGNRDFRNRGFPGREQAIKKGTAYMNVWMYVIREMEDALDDCDANCGLNCNDDPVHAWDEGVAFYTGSLEGVDGAGDGKLPYALADKRCVNFKTCGDLADEATGTSHVNIEIFREFAIGQQRLSQGKCTEARENKEKIEKMMAVPLIQGTLRYAYKTHYDTVSTEKTIAEGEVFAAAVLPIVHACNADAAATIHSSTNMSPDGKADYPAVKKAFESVYDCMGVRCADVGGLLNAAGDGYENGAGPCGQSGDDDSDNTGLIVGLVVGGVVVVALAAIFGMRGSSSGIETKSPDVTHEQVS